MIPAGGESESSPANTAVTPPLVTMATLRLRGENPFKEATLSAYADGKLLRQARLRKKEKD